MDMDASKVGDLSYSILRSANAQYMKGKGKAAEEGDIAYEGYAMLDAVYRKIATDKEFFKVVDGKKVPDISKLKKYETELEDGTFVPTAERVKQTNVGKKVEVMKDLGMFRKGAKNFDQAKADKLFEYGEKNNLFAEKAYPQQSQKAFEIYNHYLNRGKKINNLRYVGRHSEFKYWGMPETVNSAYKKSLEL